MDTPFDERNAGIQPEPIDTHTYQGHPGFATSSLIMGILSLILLCCFPPASLIFGGLGILFGALSKGTFTRPRSAKVGTGLSIAGFGIVCAIVVTALTVLLSQPRGQEFLREYINILGNSSEYSTEEIYDFFNKYYNDGALPEGYPDSYDSYGNDQYSDDYDDGYDNGEGGFDAAPYYKQQSPDDSGSMI